MKIIFIAPLSSIGGHSLVSKILLNKLKEKNEIFPIDLSLSSNHYGYFSINRILRVVNLLKEIFFLKNQAQRIYLTISQSFLGNLKDIFIYILLLDKLDKVIVHLHGGAIGENLFNRKKYLKIINFFFYKRLKTIIISGSSHYKIFPNSLHKKIKVIQNFAQGNIFNTYKNIEKKFANHPQVRILFLSNMLPEKGYIELLNGFKLLSKKIKKNLILEFAGKFYSIKSQKQFEFLIKNEENIIYHGKVSDKTKKNLLRNAHIFCLPTSFLEGQPISIIEAYASGCFVITSNKPGIKDIFKDGENGFLMNKINPLMIKRKLENILKEPNLCKKIAIENRKIAGKYFKEEKYIKHIENAIF